MKRKEIRNLIYSTNKDLDLAVKENNTAKIIQLLFALSILKDTLLESYGETCTNGAVCPVITSYVNISKYTATDFTRPLRSVK